jgi:capsular exopolysaccharide synthesis family protein
VAKEAVKQAAHQTTSSSSDMADYFQKEVDRLQKQLAGSDAALRAYMADHHMVGDPDAAPDDATDAKLKELNQELNAAQMQVTLLSERYLPEHPKLIQAKEAVAELQQEVDTMTQTASTSSSNDSAFEGLRSERNSDKMQLDSMLKELKGVQSTAQVDIPVLKVVDPATEPWVPVRPAKKKIVATGAFLGLMCGLGFVLAVYFLDATVRTVAQAENVLGMPVIAAVPIMAESDGKSILPTFSDPQSFVAESFRGLRASLILQDREHPLKTILVVSAVPGEGKSFCAANLAVAFAQAGLKTLLIDADLRLPTIQNYFQLGQESFGFPDILTGRGSLEDSVVQSQVPNLRLLLTTVAADSPAELLSTERLPQLLEEGARLYDRIVIDSAPLNAVSDTMLIMPKADAILLVVRASQTPASESKAAIEKISSSKMKPLGLILNYLPPHTLKAYSYGYSYGQKPKDKNAK